MNQPDHDLTDAERAELLALRTQVAAMNQQSRGRSRSGAGWRWMASVILIVVASLLAVVSVSARYVRSELLDTDRYVQTVGPIAANPAVQAQIADSATQALMDALDVQTVTTEALQSLADAAPNLPPRIAQTLPSLGPAIADGIQGMVHDEVLKVVRSPEFEKLWVEANRAAHAGLVSVLTGEGESAVQVSDQGEVTISLGPVIDAAKARLIDRGLGIAAKIPELDPQVTVFQSDKIAKAQRLVALLNTSANILPFIALVIAAAGVAAAPRGRRRAAVVVAGLSVAGAMALLGLGLNVARLQYLNAIPPSVVTPDAAEGVFDPLVEPLRLALRAFMVLGVVVALIAWLSGQSSGARALRRTVNTGVQRLRGDRELTSVERWIGQHQVLLQSGVVALGVITLVMWPYPRGLTVGLIALVTGLACGTIFIVGGSRAKSATVLSPSVHGEGR